MKHNIFEITLKVKGIGLEGYEKPNKAHIANTNSIVATVNNVYFDKLAKGDNVSRPKLEISQRKSGRKKSSVNCTAGIGGCVLPITIRSNGSSNIIGAAIVPTMALPNAVFSP